MDNGRRIRKAVKMQEEQTVRITLDLPKSVNDWVADFKSRTGIQKNRIIEKALLYYKKNFDTANEKDMLWKK
jgi:hypothetical protein